MCNQPKILLSENTIGQKGNFSVPDKIVQPVTV